MLKAITRRAKLVDEKVAARNAALKATDSKALPISVAYFFDHFATEEDTQVMVEEEDFWAAKRELVPSVSAEELGHYDRVRRAFEGAEKAKQEEQERARNASTREQSRSSVAAGKKVSLREARQASSGSDKGNAKGKGKGKSSYGREEEDGDESTFQTSYEDVVGDQADSTDDDYVIRTDHLKGKGNGSIEKGKGKSSGKGKAVDGFGDAADGDEDMYA
jgi:peroxin-6